jgi:isopenicillin-N epimerase
VASPEAHPAHVSDLTDPAAWALDPSVLHLNHGSYGAVPVLVRREQDRWRDIAQANPTGFYSRVLGDSLDTVRTRVAAFVRADPGGMLLQPNVTWAASTVVNTIPLALGDEVLITDDTYPAIRFAARDACVRTGARLVQASLSSASLGDGQVIVAALEQRLSTRTKLVIIDHITSATAALVETTGLVEQCREVGAAVFIDGAHGPGMLDLDVAAIGADFYAGNFHKWCCAPSGSAFLAVAPRWRERLRSCMPGSEANRGFPRSLEWWGTMDYSALLATPFALDLLGGMIDGLQVRNATLANRGAAIVSRALDQLPPDPTPLSMVALRLPLRQAQDDDSVRDLRRRIAADIGAEVMITVARGQPVLRLSAHAYNRVEDYETLAAYLGSAM